MESWELSTEGRIALFHLSPRMGQDGYGYGLITRSKRRERREFFNANHTNHANAIWPPNSDKLRKPSRARSRAGDRCARRRSKASYGAASKRRKTGTHNSKTLQPLIHADSQLTDSSHPEGL